MFLALYLQCSDMKATKIVFIWPERGDPSVRFLNSTASEQQMVAKIFVKLSGYQILKAFRRYETGRYVFFMGGTGVCFKATRSVIEKKKFL